MSNEVNLNLKKFDMRSIPDDSVVIFLGKRNTGKSFCVKDLLYYKQDIPVGVVISATESVNRFYSNIVPSLFIHDNYQEEIVQRFNNRQMKVVEKRNQEFEKNGSSNIDTRGFLIFDDCLYDNKWTTSTEVRSVFMNGRHRNTLFLLTSQFPLGIPPILRTNIDYVFIMRENIYSNRKRIYEAYAGMFPTFDIFCKVLDSCTENYECLVIHNNSKSNNLEDQVFWYKADDHGDFRMGANVFWDFHNQHMKEQSEMQEETETFDPSVLQKKSKYTVNVQKHT